MKNKDLIEHLAERGHSVKHATLTKWLRVVEEETGTPLGDQIDHKTVLLVVATLDHLRDLREKGDAPTFRIALCDVLRNAWQPMAEPEPSAEPVLVALSVEDAEVLQEILEHTRAHANWQRSVISDLGDARHELAALKAQVQAMNEAEAAPPVFNEEEKDLLFRAALQAELLERGFVVVESVEGVVLMPRTKKGRPLPVPPEPEPELSWWRRGLEWVLDRITVRQAS